MSAASGALPIGGAHERQRRGSIRPPIRLALRLLAASRVRIVAFAALFGVVAYAQPVSYRRAYPTTADRLAFAHSFANDKAIRLFYGVPHDLLTVGGYTSWRVGGILAVFAAVWGVIAAIS